MKINATFRQVTDANGSPLGYLKGKRFYDLSGNAVFRIHKTGDASTGYVNGIKSGKLFGLIDTESGCLYDTDRHYIASVAPKAKRRFPISVVSMLAFFVIGSGYILYDAITNRNAESADQPLELICVPQADGELDWSQNSVLNIFSQGVRTLPDGTIEHYIADKSIAPEDTGMYGFVLNNENDRAIEYNITLKEDNKLNMPIKFKLKMGGEYIAGSDNDWLDIDKFKADELMLTRYSSMQFELHWKWDGSDDELDTRIGSEELARYMLTIALSAGYA